MQIRELPIRLNPAQQSLKPVIPAQRTPKSDRLLAWLLLLHELKRERLIRAMLTGIQNIGGQPPHRQGNRLAAGLLLLSVIVSVGYLAISMRVLV